MATKHNDNSALQELLDARDKEILKLTQTLALVTHAKQEWERAVDAFPEMIAIFDNEHKLTRLNSALAQHLNSSYDELIGRQFCFCADAEKDPKKCLHMKALREGKSSQEERYNPEYGGHFELTVIPCHDKLGCLTGSIHIVRNINERKAFEKQRDELNTRLLHSQKLLSVGQLAAGIAHEINTPTQYAASNIDFLKESCKEVTSLMEKVAHHCQTLEQTHSTKNTQTVQSLLAEGDWEYLSQEIPQALDQCQEGFRRIGTIVGAMKEFSHPAAREKAATDLNRVITTTIQICQNEWKQIAELTTNLDPDLPHLPCHADDMGQVFLNLIVNAAHAIHDRQTTQPSHEKGLIVISSWQAEGTVKISVADNGSGIDPEIRGKIFDPFFTTKDVNKGTGQGLAISHDVITHKHNGSIEVNSEPGQGTIFTITLPSELS